jgi:hypothetical protein
VTLSNWCLRQISKVLNLPARFNTHSERSLQRNLVSFNAVYCLLRNGSLAVL